MSEAKTIWPPFEVFYIQSMLFNAKAATASVQQINAILHVVAENSPDDPVGAIPVHTFLGHLQTLVLHAAALSRYFWPARDQHSWRGVQLRQAFSVDDASPLKSRELRNAIEHFDERLDSYLESDRAGQFIPEYVGPEPESGGVPLHMFRAYFVDSGDFVLLGGRFSMPRIAEEVLRLEAALRYMDANGGRLPRAAGA
jgi:hypothetical protein